MAEQSAAPDAARYAAEDFTGRDWLLGLVEDRLQHDNKKFLLITAEPGWGKTAFVAWLAGAGPTPPDPTAARLLAQLRQRWAAVHFCVARGEGGTLRPEQFAKDVALQLARTDDDFAYALVDEIAPGTRPISVGQEVGVNLGTVVGISVERLIATQIDAQEIWNRLIRQPLKALEHRRTAHGGKTILVDALDEALTVHGTTIIDLIRDSGDLPDSVRFVMTSRDDQRILNQFRDAGRVDLDQFPQQTKDDLAGYVNARLGTSQAGELARHADGNFLYARWVLDGLASGELTDLTTLPRKLHGLYRDFLERLMPRGGDDWLERYEPLFGCLTVANPVAPRHSLPRWLGWPRGRLNHTLGALTQLVEDVPTPPEGEPGYRLYHRSIADFLAADHYDDDGSQVNQYYVDPFEQHDRIARHYLLHDATDWTSTDQYCLLQLVYHLSSRVRLAYGRQAREMAADLYRVALDPGFQAAQLAGLGGIHRTLDDLRTTLDVALTAKPAIDAEAALRSAAEFRRLATGESLSRSVFGAAMAGDIALARRKMVHYTAGPNSSAAWNDILKLYLAWEAAGTGARTDVRELIAMTAPSFPDLRDTLLIRIAETVSQPGSGALAWLTTLDPLDPTKDWAGHVRDRPIAEPQEPSAADEALSAIRHGVDLLEAASLDRDAPSAVALTVPVQGGGNPESLAIHATDLASQLATTLAHAQGRRLTEKTITLMRSNPYPQYRDMALTALGSAVLRAPDRAWARTQLQRIIRVGLDDEGITFTFDLPALLLAESERRSVPAQRLRDYLETALGQDDPWGTRMRAQSAQAAAAFRYGDRDAAFATLVAASAFPIAYSGYGSTAALALIDRCHEFGRGEQADQRTWGPQRDQTLPEMAAMFAERVYDVSFRHSRTQLVALHAQWRADPEPEAGQALDLLARMPDLDTRAAYRHHIAARWYETVGTSAPGRVASLVPSALFDSTSLDSLLALALATGLSDRPQVEIEALITVVAGSFTGGRPWTFGQWR